MFYYITVARVRRNRLQDGSNPSIHSTNSPADYCITVILITASLMCFISNTPGTLLRLLEIPRNIYGDLRLLSDFMFVFERTAHFYLYLGVHKGFHTTAKTLLFGRPAPCNKCFSNENIAVYNNGSVTEMTNFDDPQVLVTPNENSALDTVATFQSVMSH